MRTCVRAVLIAVYRDLVLWWWVNCLFARMPRKTLASLSVVIVVAYCQSYPRFELRGENLFNNSYIGRNQIGIGNNALKCVTNNTNCCSSPAVGNWTDETSGRAVHQGASGATAIYVTRGDGVVSYNRITGGSSGMWRCDIPDSSGVMQSIYIYTGTSESGESSYVLCCKCVVYSSPIRWTDLSNHLLHCPPH